MMRLFVALVLLAKPVYAEESAAATASGESAGAHFERGNVLFFSKKYVEAISEYEHALALDPQPSFVWALATARRLSGDCPAAISDYERYLSAGPTPRQSAAAHEQISVCRADLAKMPRHRARFLGSTIVGSVGLALFISALGTGVAALNAHNDLLQQCPGQDCPNLQAQADHGHALAVATDVLIGTGAVFAAATVISLVIEGRRPRH
jgi:hypothetical protein